MDANRQAAPRYAVAATLWLGALLAAPAQAQVVLDGSLGRAGALAGPNYAVSADLGRQMGGNLFHSFATFNLSAGQSATFSGPSSVNNIISRVTGGSASSIDGRIVSTIAGANFFLLNPSGVLFGPNAALDLSGSAYFSTANELRFGDGAVFSASSPATSTLTVAAPTEFGFLNAPARIDITGSRLAAMPGRRLYFSGGDIRMTGAGLNAAAGQLDLVGQPGGEISLVDSRLDAGGDANGAPGTVRIVGGRIRLVGTSIDSVNASNAAAGSISILADDSLAMRDSSVASAASGRGPGADISVAASSSILLDASRIESASRSGAAGGRVEVVSRGPLNASGENRDGSSAIGTAAYAGGNAGSVYVGAGSIDLQDGAQIGSNAFSEHDGAGAGGFILVNAAGAVSFSGVNSGGYPSGIVSISFGPGASGMVNLFSDSLALRDGGIISTSSYGTMPTAGAAGSIQISADRVIEVSGVNANGRTSGIRSDSSGPGAAGYIDVHAPRIGLLDGGQISTNSFSGAANGGAGGYIMMSASDLLLIRGASAGNRPSGVFADTGGGGDAGFIYVSAGDLSLDGGGQIRSISYGTDAGAGKGGLVVINAAGILSISGGAPTGAKSGIFANTDGPGDAGAINIHARGVELTEGGQIMSTTGGTMVGAGASGFVSIDAESVTIAGIGPYHNRNPSGIFTETYGPGAAGYIDLKIGTLDMRDGGQISTTSFSGAAGAGAGGNVLLDASGSVRLSGVGATGYSTGIYADTYGASGGGFLSLKAGRMEVVDGAQIVSATRGTFSAAGDGGMISLEIKDRLTVRGVGANGQISGIYATTQGPGAAGFITLTAGELQLLGGAQISSTSFGTMDDAGAGGYLALTVAGATLISGTGASGDRSYPSGLLAETLGPGPAGYISLHTGSLHMLDGGIISSGTYGDMTGAGKGGSIDVEAGGDILIAGVQASTGRNSKIISESYSTGSAGSITVRGRTIELSDGGFISSTAWADTEHVSEWGTITVAAAETLRIAGVNADGSRSGIFTNTEGNAFAGDIVIDARRLEVTDGGLISASSLGERSGARGEGIIKISSDSVLVSGAGPDGFPSGIYTETYGPGSAGSITVNARTMELLHGGRVSSTTYSRYYNAGDGGYVALTVAEGLSISGQTAEGKASGVFVQTLGGGDAGDVSITAGKLAMNGGAEISSATRGTGVWSGDGGNVVIHAGQVTLSGRGSDGTPTSINAESLGPGTAGAIEIHATDSLVLDAGAQIATRADHADGGNITLRVGDLLKLTDSRITTSVGSGFGNGGNIDIDPRFVVLNNSVIQANAYGGNGGNIRIVTDYLVASRSSRIEASSELGIDGKIEVSSPNVDVGAGLAVLPSRFLDASLLLRDACASQAGRLSASSFVGTGSGGLPQNPDGLFTTRYDELPLGDARARRRPSSGAGFAPDWHSLATLNLPCGARP